MPVTEKLCESVLSLPIHTEMTDETLAFIGAGAVVQSRFRLFALVVGNPARRTGWMSEFGHRLEFDDDGAAACPESGEKYILSDGKVSKNS